MSDNIVVAGRLELKNVVKGDVSLHSVVNGSGSTFYPVYPEAYTGEVEVTPSSETQVLSTAGLMMPQNVVVNPIPSNYGLITWVDGHIRVS